MSNVNARLETLKAHFACFNDARKASKAEFGITAASYLVLAERLNQEQIDALVGKGRETLEIAKAQSGKVAPTIEEIVEADTTQPVESDPLEFDPKAIEQLKEEAFPAPFDDPLQFCAAATAVMVEWFVTTAEPVIARHETPQRVARYIMQESFKRGMGRFFRPVTATYTQLKEDMEIRFPKLG